ncbi:TetR/AcrR family transcriptional regulator [Microtetraspora sp. AC03309]|uniref:TetR/AcrR family transcriptional regulator n=1 Tax=Microtetraspora sp. AC03309 TaxID=2779376 RepID=UPI00272EC859|nr:TetR/AcrR family transcriptional regulator [Microtetraspora sp. AC03309]MCC5575648.1 TetR/AcrR family transcriptional regulator [Microtetraspora sp. AC03309]
MTGPDPDDLTARARIRDAALLHFGEHGFERATIRGIAETAGVSSGLVRHHFGSKQALREACDAHLVKLISRLNDQVRADPAPADVNYVAAARAAIGPYQRYLARALAEGGAAPLFDAMVRMSEPWLADADKSRDHTPDVDRTTRAAVITAMALSVTVLHQHLSRVTGVEMFSPEGDLLLARALIDIYSHPMLSLEEAASIRAALDRVRSASPQADRESTPPRIKEHRDD